MEALTKMEFLRSLTSTIILSQLQKFRTMRFFIPKCRTCLQRRVSLEGKRRQRVIQKNVRYQKFLTLSEARRKAIFFIGARPHGSDLRPELLDIYYKQTGRPQIHRGWLLQSQT